MTTIIEHTNINALRDQLTAALIASAGCRSEHIQAVITKSLVKHTVQHTKPADEDAVIAETVRAIRRGFAKRSACNEQQQLTEQPPNTTRKEKNTTQAGRLT